MTLADQYNTSIADRVARGPVPVSECMRLAAHYEATGRFYMEYSQAWVEFTFADESKVTIGLEND